MLYKTDASKGDFEPVEGVSYITFLRDPVERARSGSRSLRARASPVS